MTNDDHNETPAHDAAARLERTERMLGAVRKIYHLVTHTPDCDELLKGICDCLMETRGYASVWIVLLDAGGTPVNGYGSGLGDAFPPLLAQLERGCLNDCARKVLEQDGLVITSDPSRQCHDCPLASRYAGHTGIAAPIRHGERIYGVLVISVPSSYAFDAREQELLEGWAEDVGFALNHLEADRESRRLRTQLERATQIIERSPAVLFRWKDSPGWPIIYVSENIRRYGYSPEDFTSGRLGLASIVHPDDADQLEAAAAARPNVTDTEGRQEYRILDAEGKIHHMLERTRSDTDEEGRSTGASGLLIDITGRRRQQARLREQEERFRDLVENSSNVFFEHSRDHVITYISPQIEALLGYTPQEAMRHWTDLVTEHPINMHGLEIAETAIRTGHRQPTYELQLRHKNGSKVWVEVREAPVVDNGITVRVTGSLANITERRAALIALRDSEERYRQLAENTPSVVFQFQMLPDGSFRIPSITQNVLGITGVPVDEIMKDPAALLGKIHPDDMAAFQKGILQSAQMLLPFMMTLRALRDGQVIWMEIRSIPKRLPDGTTQWDGFFHNVTGRKQREEAIRKLERRNSALLDHSPLCHKIVDLNFNLQYMNASGFKMLSLPVSDDWYGKPYPFDFFPEAAQIELRAALVAVKERKRIVHVEQRVCDVEGRPAWLNHSLIPVRDDEGRVEYITVVSADVTERREQENALRESEQKFRTYVESAPAGIFIADSTGRYVDVNEAACHLTGYSREELLTMTLEGLCAPSARGMSLERFGLLLQTGTIMDESVLRHKGGRGVPVLLKAVKIGDDRYMAFCTDITIRKQAEEAAAKSELLLEHAGRLARIGGWELDIETEEVTWTKETYRIHEVPMTMAPPLQDAINFYHPDDRPVLQRALRSAIEEGKSCDLELRFVTARGRELQVHVQGVPVLQNGKVVKLRGIFQDITERQQMQDRIRQMEKMDAIGKLAGGVAHDFNNQLAGIMGYADMLRLRIDDIEMTKYANNILVGARRAADLTRKLLAFSRQGQYQVVPVDLHDIIDEVVGIVSRSIDKKIVILQDLRAKHPITRGDPGQIQNAFLNLAINAADAMPEGGKMVFETRIVDLTPESPAVQFDALQPGAYVSVRLADTGAGIPQRIIGRIFDPFFTTKAVGKGTGMGLASVFGTVKNMGGSIDVTSKEGEGTTFHIHLPLESQQVEEAASREPARMASRQATILVVDDELLFRDLASDMLESLSYRVVTQSHGAAGVEYFQAHHDEVDLVILDMIMPHMSGMEAFRAMKAIQPDVKALLVSGYSASGDAAQLLQEGVVDFIQKPFDFGDVANRVAAALDD